MAGHRAEENKMVVFLGFTERVVQVRLGGRLSDVLQRPLNSECHNPVQRDNLIKEVRYEEIAGPRRRISSPAAD